MRLVSAKELVASSTHFLAIRVAGAFSAVTEIVPLNFDAAVY